jgi:hypothetical protein
MKCAGVVSNRHHAIECDKCNKWQYRKCDTCISYQQYMDARKGKSDPNLLCSACSSNITIRKRKRTVEEEATTSKIARVEEVNIKYMRNNYLIQFNIFTYSLFIFFHLPDVDQID